MYICEECGKNFEKFQDKANHVRWEHLKYSFKSDESRKRHGKKCSEVANQKYGKWVEEDVTCSKKDCTNKIHIKYREGKKKDKYFCSQSCANSKIHSKETKSKISKALKIERKYICLNCKKEFIPKKKKRKFCSNECSSEYRSKQARKNWNSYQIYKNECIFNFNLSDYKKEFDFSLIEQYGWYKAKNHGNNLNGISRDHMFSIKEGFLQKISPYIIKHPANCQLMRHNDNISKYSKCSITLEDLKNRIKEWDKKYGGLV